CGRAMLSNWAKQSGHVHAIFTFSDPHPRLLAIRSVVTDRKPSPTSPPPRKRRTGSSLVILTASRKRPAQRVALPSPPHQDRPPNESQTNGGESTGQRKCCKHVLFGLSTENP